LASFHPVQDLSQAHSTQYPHFAARKAFSPPPLTHLEGLQFVLWKGNKKVKSRAHIIN